MYVLCKVFENISKHKYTLPSPRTNMYRSTYPNGTRAITTHAQYLNKQDYLFSVHQSYLSSTRMYEYIYCTLFFTTQTSSFRRPKAFLTVLVHCKKNNLNLCIKSDLITAGADAAVFCPAFVYRCLAQKPDMRGTVYHCICSIDMLRRFRLFLGQCTSVADPDV